MISVATGRILEGFHLTFSLSQRSCRTVCGIAGRTILSVGSGSNPLMMHALVKVPSLSQAFLWLPNSDVVHLISDDYWGNLMHIKRCDDMLSWATLEIGSTSLLGRLCCPFQVSSYLLCLNFVELKAICSAVLRISTLIWRAVSIFLLPLGGQWYYFPLFCFGSGSWLHSSIFITLLFTESMKTLSENRPLSAW